MRNEEEKGGRGKKQEKGGFQIRWNTTYGRDATRFLFCLPPAGSSLFVCLFFSFLEKDYVEREKRPLQEYCTGTCLETCPIHERAFFPSRPTLPWTLVQGVFFLSYTGPRLLLQKCATCSALDRNARSPRMAQKCFYRWERGKNGVTSFNVFSYPIPYPLFHLEGPGGKILSLFPLFVQQKGLVLHLRSTVGPGHQNAALTSTYIHCQGERPPWVIGGSCDQISLTEGRGGVRGKKTPEQICDSALFFEGLKTGRGFRPPQVTVRHLGLRCVPYSTKSVSLTLPCSALPSPHTFSPRSRSQSVSKKVRRGLSLPLPPSLLHACRPFPLDVQSGRPINSNQPWGAENGRKRLVRFGTGETTASVDDPGMVCLRLDPLLTAGAAAIFSTLCWTVWRRGDAIEGGWKDPWDLSESVPCPPSGRLRSDGRRLSHAQGGSLEKK